MYHEFYKNIFSNFFILNTDFGHDHWSLFHNLIFNASFLLELHLLRWHFRACWEGNRSWHPGQGFHLFFTNSGCSFSICFLCVLTAISVPWYPRKNPHSLQLFGSLSFPQRYADWCLWRDCLSGKVLPHTHLCQDFSTISLCFNLKCL